MNLEEIRFNLFSAGNQKSPLEAEKEVAIKAERDKAGGAVKECMDRLTREIEIRIDTFSKLIMYVSPGVRKEVIKSLPKPNYRPEKLTTASYENIAAEAPHLVYPRGTGGLLGSLIAAARERERVTGKEDEE